MTSVSRWWISAWLIAITICHSLLQFKWFHTFYCGLLFRGYLQSVSGQTRHCPFVNCSRRRSHAFWLRIIFQGNILSRVQFDAGCALLHIQLIQKQAPIDRFMVFYCLVFFARQIIPNHCFYFFAQSAHMKPHSIIWGWYNMIIDAIDAQKKCFEICCATEERFANNVLILT